MKRLSLCLTALVILLIQGMASSALSADVTCLNTWLQRWQKYADAPDIIAKNPHLTNTCAEILVKGPLLLGDAQKLETLLEENAGVVSSVYLQSPGGAIGEGLKMGRIIRDNMLDVFAPFGIEKGSGVLLNPYITIGDKLQQICRGSDCVCASACFFAWAGGVHRRGEALGLHRPSVISSEYQNMPPDRASALYKGLLDSIRSHLIEMEISSEVIERMFTIPSDELVWLTPKEAEQLSMAPSLSEWLQKTCGRFSEEDNRRLMQSAHKLENRKATERDKSVVNELLQKNGAIDDCRIAKMYDHRLKKLESNTHKNQASSQNSPEAEFLSGRTQSYITKGHPKAMGIDITLKYPQSWKAEEGELPHILQDITTEYGRDSVNMMIVVTALAALAVRLSFSESVR